MPSSFLAPSSKLRRSVVLVAALLLPTLPAIAQSAKPGSSQVALARLDAQTAGFSSYVLPNGFKIILAPYPTAANARIELLVKTGSKLEGYGETGMAHLLEHMLFKSAGKRADIKSDLTALGATWNGTTTTDRTNFFETVAAEPAKIDEAIRIEADRFIRASFTKEHLASEMTVVRNELERSDNSPESLVNRALQRQSYFWHGYSRPTIGARSDIEDAPFAALQAFHKKHYRPDNAALIVSGNFEPQRVLALASQLFAEAHNPDAPKITSWTREETRATTNRSELTLPAGRTIAASAWKLPGLTDRQTHAIDIASTAICADDWGSLRKDLVLERKIAVSVSCGTNGLPDYGLLVANASAGKDADAEALSRALHDHIEKVAAKGITQEQLDRAKLNELNGYEQLENSHELLASYLSQAEVAGDWRLLFWQRDVVKSLTLDEVNAALKKWAVAVNRSDVLLRHADGVIAPELPKLATAGSLLAGKDWPPLSRPGDPVPNSAVELAKATVHISLDASAEAALISRRTQGDRAWLVLANDYGNEAALGGRRTACALADNLLSYGGGGLSRDQLSAKLETLQAEWSLGLGGLFIDAPRKNIDAALDVLLATWAAPALPEAEFDRLKTAAITRLEAGLKDPGTVAANTSTLRFDNYPAGHPSKPRSLEQQLAETRAVSYADATRCITDLSGLSKVRLGIVGEFTAQDVQAIWKRVAQLPKARTPYERVRDVAAPTTVDVAPITVAMPEKPNATIVGTALLPLTDEAADFPALRIAVKVLGGDADSRIWHRLREKEGLAYGAGVNLAGATFEPRSRLVVQASAASDKADAALSSLQDEVARALRDGFSEAEVTRAKSAWLQERKTSLRSEKAFAGSLAQGLYAGRDYAWLAQYDDKISRVSAAEVTAALRKYLATAPIVWAVGKGK